ncbi:hypothetical protein SK128_026688 [Halocaridina rubra]|uniref:Uncharacterized protein n=1 Tax=Halocaridina rubra TaxID=373956 RepID=A0AAN9A8Q5_HALRR
MDTSTEENKSSLASSTSNTENNEDYPEHETLSPSEGPNISNNVCSELEQRDELCELSFLKDTAASLTSSPLENFKSSYAKSLADSYRRASLPVVVSSPKGQYYFNNDEVISLNSSQLNPNRYLSLNTSTTTTPVQKFEPISLPTPLNNAQKAKSHSGALKSQNQSFIDIYNNLSLLDSVYVPFEHIKKLRKSGNEGRNDVEHENVITTSDGSKLVKLTDCREVCKRGPGISMYNASARSNGSTKEGQEEAMRLECIQFEGRIQQLCEILADRDGTIQRLEEDLLRMRMECQRLMVDNRSLKSTVHSSASPTCTTEPSSEVNELKQHVEILNAQLEKAERSRRTYETATRQLVEFLHTVNTTLSGSAGPHVKSVSSVSEEPNNGLNMLRRGAETVQRAESVYALPTHVGNRPRVNRSVSTYCVASIPTTKESSTTTGRTVNSEFLVTRAKELIASLKSLTRSESILKLNTEPKKQAASVSNPGTSVKDMKKENNNTEKKSSLTLPPTQFQRDDNISINSDPVLRPQTPVKLTNDTSQPLSLMVLGSSAASTEEHGYSSLPVSGFFSRHDDSEQRLVWV